MKLYRHRISMTVICEDKKLRLHEVAQIQSPGPIDYIADVTNKEMDPCVESISIEKSSPLSEKEAQDYLPYDDTDPVGNKYKAGKQYKAKSDLISEFAKLGISVTSDGRVKKSDIRAFLAQAETWLVNPSLFVEMNTKADAFLAVLGKAVHEAGQKDPSILRLNGTFQAAWDELMEALGKGHF
jgi:hypothetical protein